MRLCTFADKATAVREMVRALRPSGRVGLSDITADRDWLPAQLTGIAAWVACVAGAGTSGEYRWILIDAGLRVTTIEHHTHALERMKHQIIARLDLLKMIARPKLEVLGAKFTRIGTVLEAARAAIRDGVLDYVLLTAERN